MSIASEKLLHIENLVLHFKTSNGSVQAVDDVDFDLDTNRAVVILGESGCGKTSLSKALLRLLPRNVDKYSGKVYLHGNNVMTLDDEEHLQQTLTVNASGMQQLTDGFKNLSLEWIPSAGNFVLLDLKQTGQPIYEALLRKGVIVRPVGNYELPDHLRISIGTKEENQLFLQALSDTLANV